MGLTKSNFKYITIRTLVLADVVDARYAASEYCRQDGLEPPSGMLGYYMRLTNRVALYDTGEKALAMTSRTPSAAPQSIAAVFQPNQPRVEIDL